MSNELQDFIDFFGLADLLDGTALTVSQVIGISIVAFVGSIFCIIGVRCILELIKIVTDWRNF